MKYEIDNIEYHSCFCKYRHPLFTYYFTLHKNYEKGLLPFPGSILEQPSYIIDIFGLIDALKSDHEQEMIKAERAKIT